MRAAIAMRLQPISGGDPAAVARVGIAASLLTTVAGVFVMRTRSWDVWAGVLIVPVISALTVPLLRRIARHEDDRWIFWILLLAFAVKIAGAVTRYYATFSLLGPADAVSYHKGGVELAARFREFNFDTHLETHSEGPLIQLVTGILYAIIGPSKGGAFIIFSWFAFLGFLAFYRAFRLAVPNGSARWYAALLFFFPSLVFWPSSIGKEAWMLLALGIAAYGSARVLTGSMLKGAAWAVIGMVFAYWVRPHMAGLIGVALAVAVVVRRRRADGRRISPIARLTTIVAMIGLAGIFVVQANTFLSNAGIDASGGINAALAATVDRTAIGGTSDFEPAVATSPANIPAAVVTVLFRPFIFEARNLQATIAAFEGSFLLGLLLIRLRSVGTAVRNSFRSPYLLMCLAYLALFVLAFSSFANFGLLARERTQVMPFLFVLLSLPRGFHALDDVRS